MKQYSWDDVIIEVDGVELKTKSIKYKHTKRFKHKKAICLMCTRKYAYYYCFPFGLFRLPLSQGF